MAYFSMEESGQNRTFIMSASPNGRDQRVLIDSEHEPGAPEYSPDGAKLAFRCRTSLCIGTANGSRIERIVGHGAGDPDWSPRAGRLVITCWIEDFHDRGVCVVDSDGRHLRMVSEGALYPAWGEKGLLAYRGKLRGRYGLVVSKPNGSNRQLIVRDTDRRTVGQIDWHPNGKKLVYDASSGSVGATIFAIRADGTHRKRIVQGTAPVVSPDGEWILFNGSLGGSSGIFAIRFDGSGRHLVIEDDQDRWNATGDWQPLIR